MKNQLLTELASELASIKQNHCELEKRLHEQQAELASLREDLARKGHPAFVTPVPAPLSAETSRPQRPDTTRRRMLKRIGLAVLAGGAALGITAATYSPAEAKLTVSASTTNIGATATRTGATITGIPTITNFGLVASADNTFDASGLPKNSSSNYSIGIAGVSSQSNYSIGVYGSTTGGTGVEGDSNSGTGVLGKSQSSHGVYGNSQTGYGVYGDTNTLSGVYGYSYSATGVSGETYSSTNPAINAKNNSTSGSALRIEQGGFTIKGAGLDTSTAAFIHQTTSGNIVGDGSKIDNPLCNNRQNALLLVTHNWNPVGATPLYESKVVGIYYNEGFWWIFHEDTTPMSTGLYFNVLIINP